LFACFQQSAYDPAVQTEEQVAEDVALIQQIGQGNRAAFEKFHRQYANLIFSTTFKVLNNQSDAEDVTQDVMFMLWEKSPMFDASRGKPLTWVTTMARNKAIDRLRSIQRRSRLHDEVECEAGREANVSFEQPADSMDSSEQGQIVRSAVMKLNREQRQVIEMSYFMGLTQQQISERINAPLGTVKARIRRGMLRLKKIVSTPL
jgi:RNA polymerase sigma-70 factor (ECF subfamily)